MERRDPEARAILAQVYPAGGRAWVVGVTGAPGVGKSTLVDRLAGSFLAQGGRVGILAVDPSSPYTGGALLGDRIRLEQAGARIFFRSLASRGAAGGLSGATRDTICLMDAFGLDPILLETVGAGQSEVAVMAQAHTTLVVLAPGLGDDVQAEKAGILEIADVLAVNKADLAGAEALVGMLRRALSLSPAGVSRPPVVQVRALQGTGVDELLAALTARRERPPAASAAQRRTAAEAAVREHLARLLLEAAVERVGSRYDEILEQVAHRQQDPGTAAERILGLVLPAPRPGTGPPA